MVYWVKYLYLQRVRLTSVRMYIGTFCFGYVKHNQKLLKNDNSVKYSRLKIKTNVWGVAYKYM